MEPLSVIYLCLTVILLIASAIILHDKIMDRREQAESRARASATGRTTKNHQSSLLRKVIADLGELPDDASFTQIKAALDRAALIFFPLRTLPADIATNSTKNISVAFICCTAPRSGDTKKHIRNTKRLSCPFITGVAFREAPPVFRLELCSAFQTPTRRFALAEPFHVRRARWRRSM